jgi:hypothetical protein
MENYLSTLPSTEEVLELKRKFQIRDGECQDMRLRLDGQRLEIERLTKDKSETKDKLIVAESEASL